MLARVLMTSVAAAALAGAAMAGPASAQNRHGGGGGGHSAAAISDGAGVSEIVGAGPTRNIGGLSAENDAAFRHDMRISGGEGRDRILGSPTFGGRRFAARGFVGRGYYARDWGDNWRWRRFGWGWGSPVYASYDYDRPAYAGYGYRGCICRSPYASVGWRRPYASVGSGW